MSVSKKVDCTACKHLRTAPYEARRTGCYLPGNMSSKQSASYLDEQQIAGDHEKINLRGDCPDFEAKAATASFWKRLIAG